MNQGQYRPGSAFWLLSRAIPTPLTIQCRVHYPQPARAFFLTPRCFMIRQLAVPYCNGCEIALDDHPELVFNPATETRAPCRTWPGWMAMLAMGTSGARGRPDDRLGQVSPRCRGTQRRGTHRSAAALPAGIARSRAGLGFRPGRAPRHSSPQRGGKTTNFPGAKSLRSGMWTAGPYFPGTRPGSGSCRPARNASWLLSKSMKQEKRREERAGEPGNVPVSPRTHSATTVPRISVGL